MDGRRGARVWVLRREPALAHAPPPPRHHAPRVGGPRPRPLSPPRAHAPPPAAIGGRGGAFPAPAEMRAGARRAPPHRHHLELTPDRAGAVWVPRVATRLEAAGVPVVRRDGSLVGHVGGASLPAHGGVGGRAPQAWALLFLKGEGRVSRIGLRLAPDMPRRGLVGTLTCVDGVLAPAPAPAAPFLEEDALAGEGGRARGGGGPPEAPAPVQGGVHVVHAAAAHGADIAPAAVENEDVADAIPDLVQLQPPAYQEVGGADIAPAAVENEDVADAIPDLVQLQPPAHQVEEEEVGALPDLVQGGLADAIPDIVHPPAHQEEEEAAALPDAVQHPAHADHQLVGQGDAEAGVHDDREQLLQTYELMQAEWIAARELGLLKLQVQEAARDHRNRARASREAARIRRQQEHVLERYNGLVKVAAALRLSLRNALAEPISPPAMLRNHPDQFFI